MANTVYVGAISSSISDIPNNIEIDNTIFARLTSISDISDSIHVDNTIFAGAATSSI